MSQWKIISLVLAVALLVPSAAMASRPGKGGKIARLKGAFGKGKRFEQSKTGTLGLGVKLPKLGSAGVRVGFGTAKDAKGGRYFVFTASRVSTNRDLPTIAVGAGPELRYRKGPINKEHNDVNFQLGGSVSTDRITHGAGRETEGFAVGPFLGFSGTNEKIHTLSIKRRSKKKNP